MRLAEKRTDAILDGEKDTEAENVQPKSNEEFIEETVAKCEYHVIRQKISFVRNVLITVYIAKNIFRLLFIFCLSL